jgi:PhnB protein
MSKRPPRPAGYPWLTPYLVVSDADAAIDFYQRAFGFVKRMALKGPNGKSCHVEMTFNQDSLIMFGTPHEGGEWPQKPPALSKVAAPISLYVYCDDVDMLFQRAVAAGAKVYKEPKDQFYGDRTCCLEDPDGYQWHFATNVADFDPNKTP